MNLEPGKYSDDVVTKSKRTVHLKKEDRESLWFVGDNVQIILNGDHTDGKLMFAYSDFAPGSMPALHEHAIEDEIFLILEGSVTYWTVGHEFTAVPGDAILLPIGVPHTFRADPEVGAKVLAITTPAGFEAFLRALSVPAEYEGHKVDFTPDELGDDFIDRAAAAGAEIGITFYGPPGARP